MFINTCSFSRLAMSGAIFSIKSPVSPILNCSHRLAVDIIHSHRHHPRANQSWVMFQTSNNELINIINQDHGGRDRNEALCCLKSYLRYDDASLDTPQLQRLELADVLKCRSRNLFQVWRLYSGHQISESVHHISDVTRLRRNTRSHIIYTARTAMWVIGRMYEQDQSMSILYT